MQFRIVPRFIAAVLIGVGFLLGLALGSTGIIGVRPPVLTGNGYVGAGVVTLFSGGTAYGARDSIPWRGEDGAERDRGWPDCLPATTEVTNVRFVGANVWHGSSGQAQILWVDCSAGT